MDKRIPKAWLPAYNFTLEAERRYQDLLSDLCAVGQPFELKCWDWDGYQYQHSVNAGIKPSSSPEDSAVIELRVTKKYQSHSDVKALEETSFKRFLPTSPFWTRVMLGQPSPNAIANHALAGIKFAASFKPNMGFKVVAESPQVQSALDEVKTNHKVWGMPSTGDLLFLNT
jgi:hypothetical protein